MDEKTLNYYFIPRSLDVLLKYMLCTTISNNIDNDCRDI